MPEDSLFVFGSTGRQLTAFRQRRLPLLIYMVFWLLTAQVRRSVALVRLRLQLRLLHVRCSARAVVRLRFRKFRRSRGCRLRCNSRCDLLLGSRGEVLVSMLLQVAFAQHSTAMLRARGIQVLLRRRVLSSLEILDELALASERLQNLVHIPQVFLTGLLC